MGSFSLAQHAAAFALVASLTLSFPGLTWGHSSYAWSGYGRYNGLPRHFITSSVPGAPSCAPGSRYSLTMSELQSTIPGFEAPTMSCGTRQVSPSNAEACLWHPRDFLAVLFDRGIEVMRMGIPQEDAFRALIHARYVLHNLRVCDPIHNSIHVAEIPQALESLYGEMFANYVTRNRAGLAMTPEPISARRQRAISDIGNTCVSWPIDLEFPDRLLPWPSLVGAVTIPTSSSRILIPGPNNSSEIDPTARQSYNVSRSCNTPGNPPNMWTSREFKHTGLVHADQHCCASACTYLLAAISIVPSNSLLDPCCQACNKFNCQPQNAEVTAALNLRTRIEVPALLDGYASIVTFAGI
jgi:hypothetical protein